MFLFHCRFFLTAFLVSKIAFASLSDLPTTDHVSAKPGQAPIADAAAQKVSAPSKQASPAQGDAAAHRKVAAGAPARRKQEREDRPKSKQTVDPLPVGSQWIGERATGGATKRPCEMTVESRAGDIVVFLVDEGDIKTRWTAKLDKRHLKVTGIVFLKKGGIPSRQWSDTKGSGSVSADKLTLRWSWHMDGPKRKIDERGSLTLRPKVEIKKAS